MTRKNNRLLFQHIVVSLNRKLMIKQSKSTTQNNFISTRKQITINVFIYKIALFKIDLMVPRKIY